MAYLQMHNRITVQTGVARDIGNGTIMPANQLFTFDSITHCKITENTENLIDTAEVGLAKGFLFDYTTDDGNKITVTADLLFQIGDYITIETWYTLPQINTTNPSEAVEINSSKDYKATFTGYISDIEIGSPLLIKCENEMWALKNNNRLFPDDFLTGRKLIEKGVTTVVPANPIIQDDGSLGKTLGAVRSYDPKKTSLDEILQVYLYDTFLPISNYQFTKFNVSTVSVQIPGYKTDDAFSLVQIFDDLKDYAGIYAYFRDGNLYIGPEAWLSFQQTQIFAFQQNIIDASNLTFQLADSVKYRIEIINIKNLTQTKIKNSKPKTKTTNKQVLQNDQSDYFGDADGQVKKLFVYNFDTDQKDAQQQLEDMANAELLKYKYTGYAGSFTTFGAPVVYKGDIVTLYDPDAPERGGQQLSSYLVRSVEREFSADNATYRQRIYISRKI